MAADARLRAEAAEEGGPQQRAEPLEQLSSLRAELTGGVDEGRLGRVVGGKSVREWKHFPVLRPAVGVVLFRPLLCEAQVK